MSEPGDDQMSVAELLLRVLCGLIGGLVGLFLLLQGTLVLALASGAEAIVGGAAAFAIAFGILCLWVLGWPQHPVLRAGVVLGLLGGYLAVFTAWT